MTLAFRNLLTSAAQRGRRSAQCFVDVYSGSGGIGKSLQRAGDFGCAQVDARNNSALDATRPEAQKVLLGNIAMHRIRGLWIAFPCTTWCQAAHGTYRSIEHLWGKPDLPFHLQQRLQLGSATFLTTLKLVRAATKHGIPIILENPAGSLAWKTEQMQALMGLECCTDIVVDQCQLGRPWQKATRLVAWNVCDPPRGLQARCQPTRLKWIKVCSHTLRPHVVLRGRIDGCLATQLAEAYPPRLNQLGAQWLQQSADSIERHCLHVLGYRPASVNL